MGFGTTGPLAVLLALPGAIRAPVGLLALGLGAWVGGEYADRTRRREEPIEDSDQLREFLRMNPEERFDLEAITSFDMRALFEEASRDREQLKKVMETVQALFPRVLSETEDAGLAGSFLRNKTLDWYRRSPSDPKWSENMIVRWGGIFHESRTAGGRLCTKLTSRLSNLHLECAKASGVLSSFTGGLHRGMTVIKSYRRGRRPSHSVMLQVCQAYLDDLALNPRNAERPFPLEKLSEVSRRIGAADVNLTLGELFPQPGGGPFTVLDPRFHIDMDALVIRVQQPKGIGDAGAYALVHAKSTEGREMEETSATAGTAKSSPWEREDFSKDEWHELLEKLNERSERLEAPPVENHRKRRSYIGLRNLILTHPAARKAFGAVHWRGKPGGLALVCRLLNEGTFVPEVETDADYLEAELGHIASGNADGRPSDGTWDIGHGWKVVREVSPGNGRIYRAERVSFD